MYYYYLKWESWNILRVNWGEMNIEQFLRIEFCVKIFCSQIFLDFRWNFHTIYVVRLSKLVKICLELSSHSSFVREEFSWLCGSNYPIKRAMGELRLSLPFSNLFCSLLFYLYKRCWAVRIILLNDPRSSPGMVTQSESSSRNLETSFCFTLSIRTYS